MGENGSGLRRWLRPGILPLAVLAVVVALWVVNALYMRSLEREVKRLEHHRDTLEEAVRAARRLDPEMGVRCPPVLELDPAWAGRRVWGPGGEQALPLLEGGTAAVRLIPAGEEEEGPALAWNRELRVYELPAEAAADGRAFHLGVRLPSGGWARTVPSNWPGTLCEPWIDCAGGGCRSGCLDPDLPPDAVPPPARMPPPCVLRDVNPPASGSAPPRPDP